MQTYILFFDVLLLILSVTFFGYALHFSRQAKATLRKAELSASRATKVFQSAQELRNETLVIQENIRVMLPNDYVEPPLVQDVISGEPAELTLAETAPVFDYVNFQGLPVTEPTPEAVMSSLRDHGFIVRISQPTFEVQVAYQKPQTNNEPVRATYKPPADIFPVNNLHEAGKAATALWAAKRFVAQFKFPEFENYPYL